MMKTIRTYEEFWPFSKKPVPTQTETNKKKISDIPKKISELGIGKSILGLKINKIEIGHSKVYQNRLIVEFRDDFTHDSVRINFKTDDEFFVIGKDSCYLMSAGKIEVHSFKHFKLFKSEVKEMEKLQESIMQLFVKEGLVKSDEQS